MTTEAIIAATWKALERLRKLMKSKEVFDIVHEVEANQKELESKVVESEAHVKKLEEEIACLKESHSTEIAQLQAKHAEAINQLKDKHATEIAKFQKASNEQSGHTIGRPSGY